jgi:hypothetical protein
MTETLTEEIIRLQAENARLREALKPFAAYVDQLEGKIPPKGSGPSMANWHAARAALTAAAEVRERQRFVMGAFADPPAIPRFEMKEKLKSLEAATIERCAQVADNSAGMGYPQIAAAIRALKDQP